LAGEELVGVGHGEDVVHQTIELIEVCVEDDGLVCGGEGLKAAPEHVEDGSAATALLAYGDSFLKTSVCVAHDQLS
jgi:hypothetical protein